MINSTNFQVYMQVYKAIMRSTLLIDLKPVHTILKLIPSN